MFGTSFKIHPSFGFFNCQLKSALMNLSDLMTVRFDLINFLLVSVTDILLLSVVLTVVAHVLHQLGVPLLRLIHQDIFTPGEDCEF